MGLARRVERLEDRRKPYGPDPVSLVILKEHLNAYAEARGEEIEPWTPEELPYRIEAERWTLSHVIPTFRAEPGWRGEEECEFLDKWERSTIEKIEELEKGESA